VPIFAFTGVERVASSWVPPLATGLALSSSVLWWALGLLGVLRAPRLPAAVHIGLGCLGVVMLSHLALEANPRYAMPWMLVAMLSTAALTPKVQDDGRSRSTRSAP
jgi:hypothetical protein